MKQCNAYLRELYLDFVNNYLTVEKMAEHHEMSVPDMVKLLVIGKTMHEEHVNLHAGT